MHYVKSRQGRMALVDDEEVCIPPPPRVITLAYISLQHVPLPDRSRYTDERWRPVVYRVPDYEIEPGGRDLNASSRSAAAPVTPLNVMGPQS